MSPVACRDSSDSWKRNRKLTFQYSLFNSSANRLPSLPWLVHVPGVLCKSHIVYCTVDAWSCHLHCMNVLCWFHLKRQTTRRHRLTSWPPTLRSERQPRRRVSLICYSTVVCNYLLQRPVGSGVHGVQVHPLEKNSRCTRRWKMRLFASQNSWKEDKG